MSYSGYKSSPRGSRSGYRGGGYRGSRGGEGGGWRGSSRGYAGSSRGSGRGGRFSSSSGKWERDDSSSYDSRSRYSGGGSDRYSSHGREDSSYRYRGDDGISYSSRDHSHRVASPDRKRMRTEYSPASSMHRSHDYGDGMEYSSSRSYGSYEGKRMSGYGGGDDRRLSSFREERERIRSDDYQFRKPLSIGGPRHSTPRGSSYRGRSSFSRGLRSSFRRSEAYRGDPFLRKRSAVGSYGIRKPMGRTQEYLRRLKLYRIQRLRRLRERAEKEGSGDDEEGEEEEVEEEQEVEEEVTDEETEEQEKEDEEKVKKETENEDEEMEVSGEEKKDEEKKKKKVKKIVKIIKKVKRKVLKKKEEEKDKDESGENKDIQVTVKQDSEGRDVDAPVRKNYLGQPFIKLECPHCHTNCETFKEYMLHLHKSKHKLAMGTVTARVSKALAKLRMEQRTEQKDIDEEAKLNNMNMRTFFCMTCKLNYRSLKSEHLKSDKHKEIKNFLTPYCKICRVTCKSPMQYENHICSLFHLKRKYFYDKKHADNTDGSEIDMDKFMVLDQVGSGEDDDEEEEDGESETDEKEGGEENEDEKEKKEGEEEAGEEGTEKPKEKKVKKKKKQINLGSEYCKKISIYFCELCKTFLPRIEDQEQALAVHCRGSLHLRWYVRKKDDLALRKRAERIHRLREAQKKAESKEEDLGEAVDEDVAEDQPKVVIEPEIKNEPKPGNGNGMNEKVWDEVNADLSHLMTGSDEPPKVEADSDDDEDSRAAGRRYDRFKHSEKAKSGAGTENEKSTDEKSAKAGVVNGDEDKDA